MPVITLTTDFGTRDWFVAAMKGIILRAVPTAVVVDVTHEIDAHNIIQGAFVLRQAIQWFPRGTVHAVVVDPGVGTARRIIAAGYAGQFIVAPDNGLISLIHAEMQADEMYAVENSAYFARTVSKTFHGRDIIAPVAANVASGLPLSRLGPAIDNPVLLDVSRVSTGADGSCEGSVVYIDRFGNLVANIDADDLAAMYRNTIDVEVFVADRCVGPIRGAYGDVPTGEPLALIGSTRALEISINGGRAADALEACVGTPVSVRLRVS